MTRNDELKAGQGMTTEEAQSLLNNVKHTQAEYDAVVRRENPGLMVSMTAEQYRWQRLMHLAETRLLQAAPALAEAYLGSEAQLEAVTLERDRLAHELRLLREAVGGLSQKWAQKADDCGEAAMRFEEGSEAGASMGATSSTYDKCASAARLILTPLSSDTPERSGGEG